MPLPDPLNAGAFERRQTQFMLHSTAHWQKTVHGYSGWRAPLHEQLYLQMRNFPDEASLRGLAALGVTYVVVHTELYPPGEWPQSRGADRGFGAQLRLEHVAAPGGSTRCVRPRRSRPGRRLVLLAPALVAFQGRVLPPVVTVPSIVFPFTCPAYCAPSIVMVNSAPRSRPSVMGALAAP